MYEICLNQIYVLFGVIFLFVFTIYDSDSVPLATIIADIKNGDERLREEFIKNYIPFILKVISKSVPGQQNIKNSDEYSIGLIAFNEAIEKFDIEKSKIVFNFFNFAEQVIKRRIIDHMRFVSKRKNEVPFSYYLDCENTFEDKYLKNEYDSSFNRIELFQELKHFDKLLEEFGLSVKDLHKYTPKHKDSRDMCVDIAKKIAGNKEIYQKIITKKYFPMKDLLKIIDVHPRTIQRNREYILSICLIYGNGYDHIQSYLGNTTHRGESNVR